MMLKINNLVSVTARKLKTWRIVEYNIKLCGGLSNAISENIICSY